MIVEGSFKRKEKLEYPEEMQNWIRNVVRMAVTHKQRTLTTEVVTAVLKAGYLGNDTVNSVDAACGFHKMAYIWKNAELYRKQFKKKKDGTYENMSKKYNKYKPQYYLVKYWQMACGKSKFVVDEKIMEGVHQSPKFALEYKKCKDKDFGSTHQVVDKNVKSKTEININVSHKELDQLIFEEIKKLPKTEQGAMLELVKNNDGVYEAEAENSSVGEGEEQASAGE